MAIKRAEVSWVQPTPYAMIHLYVAADDVFWLSGGKLLATSFINGRRVDNGQQPPVLARFFRGLFAWVWLTPYRDVWYRFHTRMYGGDIQVSGLFSILKVPEGGEAIDFGGRGVLDATGYPFLGYGGDGTETGARFYGVDWTKYDPYRDPHPPDVDPPYPNKWPP